MVVVKNRYLVMEVFCEGDGPALSHSSIASAIKDSLLLNFGEFGLGSSLTSLQVKYLNPVTKLCVIRCSRAEYEKIWCAITFITSINGYPLFFNLLDLSGSIRCCKEATLEYDKAKIEMLKLRSGKNQLSSKQLEAANTCLEKISQLEM